MKSEKTERRVRILLSACMFINFANIMVIPPMLPNIISDLDVSGGIGAQTIGVFGITMAISTLFWGPICDRYGRKQLISIGLIFSSITMTLCAVAPNFHLLRIFCILAGISGGIFFPSILAFAGDFFPYEKRNLAIGQIMSGFFLARMIIAPGSAFIADFASWRWVFLALSIISLMVGLKVILLLPNIKPDHKAEKSDRHIFNPSYLAILRNRPLLSAAAITALIRASMMGILSLFSVWLVFTYEITLKTVALVILIGGIAGLMSSPAAGRIANRFGNENTFIFSSAGISIMVLILPLITFDLLWLTLCFALMSSLSAFRMVSFNTILTELVPQARATMLSLNNSIGHVGLASGAVIGGLLYERLGYFSVGAVLSMITIASIILFITQVKDVSMVKRNNI